MKIVCTKYQKENLLNAVACAEGHWKFNCMFHDEKNCDNYCKFCWDRNIDWEITDEEDTDAI